MEKQNYRPIHPYMAADKLIVAAREEQPAEVRLFWANEMVEIQGLNSKEVKNRKQGDLPLARVKKIMKADEVKMVSAEAVVVLAKACELFMKEVSVRAWVRTQDAKRRTLQKKDVWAAVGDSDVFDFLVDIIPRAVQMQFEKEEVDCHMEGTRSGTGTGTGSTGTGTGFDYANPMFNFMLGSTELPLSNGFMWPWSSY